jgi:hypothetical protein
MPIIVRNLRALALANNAETSLYTATGVTTLVTSLRLSNRLGTAQQVSIWIQGPAGNPAKRFLVRNLNVPAVVSGVSGSTTVTLPGEITLSAGYELRVQTSAASGGLHCFVSGIERT